MLEKLIGITKKPKLHHTKILNSELKKIKKLLIYLKKLPSMNSDKLKEDVFVLPPNTEKADLLITILITVITDKDVTSSENLTPFKKT